MKHEHTFEKLNDHAIFCACGEIRSEPVHGYAPCPFPHWYQPPYWSTSTYRITTGGTTSLPNVTVWNDSSSISDQVTFTT